MITITTRRARCALPIVRIQNRKISWQQHQLDVLDAEKRGVLEPPPADIPSPILWRAAQLSSFYFKSIPVALSKGGKDFAKTIPFLSLLPLALLGKYPQSIIPTPCLLPAQASRLEPIQSFPSRADLQDTFSAFLEIVHDPDKWPRPLSELPQNVFEEPTLTAHQTEFLVRHAGVLLDVYKLRFPRLLTLFGHAVDWDTKFSVLRVVWRAIQMENREIYGRIGVGRLGEMQLDVLLKDRGVPVYVYRDVLTGVEEKRRVLEWLVGDGEDSVEKIIEKTFLFGLEYRKP